MTFTICCAAPTPPLSHIPCSSSTAHICAAKQYRPEIDSEGPCRPILPSCQSHSAHCLRFLSSARLCLGTGRHGKKGHTGRDGRTGERGYTGGTGLGERGYTGETGLGERGYTGSTGLTGGQGGSSAAFQICSFSSDPFTQSFSAAQ